MICKLIRFLISDALDSDRELSVLVKWHIKHCPACRHFQVASQTLMHRLITDASEADPIPACATTPVVFPHRKPALMVAAVLACLITIGLAVLNRGGREQPDVSGSWLVAAVDDLSTMGQQFVSETPLEREIAFVQHDTKGAIKGIMACSGLDSFLGLMGNAETL